MKKKRAVILTGQAGQGHFSMAKAYKYWLEQWGYQAEVYDVLPPLSQKVLNLLYRIPKAFESLYKLSDQLLLAQGLVDTVALEIERRIAKTVPDFDRADLIISSHFLIRPHGNKVPKIMLLLDPLAHAVYFTSPKPNYYLALWERIREDAQRFRIPEESLFLTLPLARTSFYQMGKLTLKDKENVKVKIRRKLKVPQSQTLILVMAGSGWLHRVEPYLEFLRKTFKDEKVTFVFLCGKNQSFREKMLESYGDDPKFRFLAWLGEEEIAEWMVAADFGLAFSLAQMSVEAGLVGLPLFIFRVNGGQEEGYKEVISRQGVGMYIPGEPKNQVDLLKVLLTHAQGLFDKNLKSWQKQLMTGPLKTRRAIEQILS
ncbi:MAG: hypothetical protein ACOX50_00825 [Patescibacteria group bacterium]|jgi:hypothetical protein